MPLIAIVAAARASEIAFSTNASDERREQPADGPLDPADLRADERQHGTDVARRRQRRERPREQPVLVQRDRGGDHASANIHQPPR